MMSSIDHERMAEESRAYRKELGAFLNGAMSEASFRETLARVGIREQRQSNAYMVTVHGEAGAFESDQLRIIAHLARTRGNAIVHLTIDQGLQLHNLRLQDTGGIIEGVLYAGLTCGTRDAMRNISTCPRAGVCLNEGFDVTPYGLAMGDYLARRQPDLDASTGLKVAFSGCGSDCALCSVADLGFFATVRDGVPGFSVYAGGSVAANAALAVRIEEFVPVNSIFPVAEAMRRLLSKAEATPRSMVEHLGPDGFRSLYRREIADVGRKEAISLQFGRQRRMSRVPSVEDPAAKSCRSFNEWKDKNTFPQHQEGLATVELPLALGDISSRALHMIASLSEQYGDGSVHVTANQDLQLRGIQDADLYNVFLRLRRIGRKLLVPPAVKFVSCAGASVCKLGLCQSRELAEAVEKALASVKARLDVPIHISGCPNACGRHPVAAIGLYGGTIEFDGRLVPAYTIVAGGHASEGHAALAEPIAKVPARAVPLLLEDFLTGANVKYRDGESIDELMDRWGVGYLRVRSRMYSLLPTYEEAPEVYRDFGADDDFTPADEQMHAAA